MADEARVLRFSEEELEEMALVDIAYEILRNTNEPIYYRDLMQEVAKVRKLSETEINEIIARLYTEINIDGRFICIGNNIWGLKRWYPVDKTMEKSTGPKGFIRKDVDEDFYDDEDEELYDDINSEEDDFDSFDEDDEVAPDDEDFDIDEEEEEESLIDEESLDELQEEESEELDEEEEDI
ncbi:DNA-directed RNA polymerase subunit delta [Fodinisporobacter ferrooxydans]|uniref:Probable DNA-directed RNA polymerase subunit delta n=1 Tax=Fodinisporobacter ferrooxydans TaxID=2901836 RepID=A0ABY4CM99_9BACL|nr:DNA-directed RNA polymerase subunit delta [Alicyclobacillaceae bacterium MYW30-H2]